MDRLRGGDQSALEIMEQIAHSIHGAGAMFGFSALSKAGGDVERMVGIERRKAPSAPPPPSERASVLQQLTGCTERLARELEAAWQITPSAAGLISGH
jgi:chemotaxis protein histidine kinase CheA